MFANTLTDDLRNLAATTESLNLPELFEVLGDFEPSDMTDSFTDLSFLDPFPMPISCQRKRLLSADTGNNGVEVVVADDQQIVSPLPTSCVKKPRKPSHIVAKEAREDLLAQVRHLEIQRSLIRQEAGIVDPEVEATKHTLNTDLQSAVLQHDLRLASAQSSFSGYVYSRATSPLATYIHLGTDWDQRRRTLLEMQDSKIAAAQQFLLERTRHMSPFKASREASSFETEQGDMCAVTVDVTVDVTPFEGATSMREVFDALRFFFANVEILKTELYGKITIRENDPSDDCSATQHRLVTSHESGVLEETNLVLFYDASGLDAECVDDQCVIITGDFVDRDDLYPYRPSERVRKDVSSVIKLSAHRRRRCQASRSERPAKAPDHEKGEEQELVVVLTRWFFTRLHSSEMDVPNQILQTMADGMGECIDAMLRSVQEGLVPPIKQETRYQ